MKKIILFCCCVLFLFGCGSEKAAYTSIPMSEAKTRLETEKDILLVDVRSQEEFAQGHIPGAICIPNEEIKDKDPELLSQKDQLIFIYCRSGNRSKQASEKLAKLGYTNIVEIGGILDWTGDIEN